MTSNQSRRVLITGASKGIGKAIAIALASSGFDVVCNARQSVTDVLDEIENAGGHGSSLIGDVTNREDIRNLISDDIARQGAYYGIVCNAGINKDSAFPALRDSDWDDVLSTSLNGFFNVVQPCVMPMIRRRDGGRIVTIASVAGLIGNRGQANYSAAKAGVIGATKSLAMELAKRNITVNCVAPGFIETNMTSGVSDDLIRQLVPMRRLGRAEEVASLVEYLFSPAASYITRQAISMNGGMV